MATSNQGGFDPFEQVHQGVQRLLDEVFSGPPQPHRPDVTWRPPMDVYHTGDELVIKVAISGVKREDIDVQFTGGSLRISGERKEECDDCKEGYYLMEIDYGPFFREVPLPQGSQPDKITATYQDGFLFVRVPLGGGNRTSGRGIPIR